MIEEQKAIVERAMRDYLRAVEEFKCEDNVPATLKTVRKLLMIIEILQTENDGLNAIITRLRAENDRLSGLLAGDLPF